MNLENLDVLELTQEEMVEIEGSTDIPIGEYAVKVLVGYYWYEYASNIYYKM